MGDWIDFKRLRQQLDFSRVLTFYGVEVNCKQGARQHTGPCPLPVHKQERRKPSFSANLERGLFRCFGCGASGNAMDFIAIMEGLSPSNPADIRKTAKFIMDRGLSNDGGDPASKPPQKVTTAALPPVGPAPAPSPAPQRRVLVNEPLDFELKQLDPDHPYLKERGLHPETIAHFGLGYCTRGLLKGRIAIPLHDADRRLIGYAGRVVDGGEVSDKNPEYLFPPPRERDGVLYEFSKGLFLYAPNDLKTPVEDLIVVQSFPSVWWLWQWQYRHVVALMGGTCSRKQASLIVESVVPDGSVWIMTDGDEAGRISAGTLLESIAPHRFCRWVVLQTGQPTDLTPADLSKLLWHI